MSQCDSGSSSVQDFVMWAHAEVPFGVSHREAKVGWRAYALALRSQASVDALSAPCQPGPSVQVRPDVRAGPDSAQQGAERGGISVAHLRRDLLDALRRRAQQMDGALGPQTLHERERAHAERSLGPSLEGAPAGTDRRRQLPDIQRLAQAGAGLLFEGKYQPI